MSWVNDVGECVLAMRLPITDPLPLQIKVGDFNVAVVAGGLGAVLWRGIEILRGVNCVLRDKDWATFSAENIVTTAPAVTSPSQSTLRQTFDLGGSADVDLTITIAPAGRLELAVEIIAKRDFSTNRIGLVVLHPIRNVAGTRVTVVHPDQSETETEFPKLVSPSQPVAKIKALSHSISGVDVYLNFSGDVFEMEDQRNWSDASFKTYCRPLALPFPFHIKKGEIVRQKLTLELAATAGVATNDLLDNETVPDIHFAKWAKVPEILLAIEAGWLPSAEAMDTVKKLKPAGVLVRVVIGETDADTRDAVLLVRSAQHLSDLVDLEIVMTVGDPTEILHRFAAKLRDAGVSLRHVFALPITFMQSYQPGQSPPVSTLNACIAAAASAFPHARIGAGMMTNFTEMNRNKPLPGIGHFVTHGNTAIVHSADDRSVWQTLEALPDIFETAQTIASGRPYRLGLVSIGMRSNPYGAGLVSNPDRQKIAMAGDDPRQITTFAAAYAVGVAVAAAIAKVEAVALAAPFGPFKVMRSDGPQRAVFPIFHAIRGLNQFAGLSVTVLQGLDQGLVGLQASDGAVLVANCSPQSATFEAATPMVVRLLHDNDPATLHPDWLDTARTVTGQNFNLASGSCLFGKTAVLP